MCSVLAVNPNDESVKELIVGNTTKQNINRMLSEIKGRQVENTGLTEDQAKALVQFGYGSILFPDTGATNDLDKYLQHYTQYSNEAQNYLRRAVEAAERVRSQAGVGIDLSVIIQQCCASGFYALDIVSPGYIEFITAPVTCAEVNVKAGVRRTVYLGQYIVRYQPKTAQISVLKYKDNISSAGHYHPHVNAQGSVCWGNARDLLRGLVRFELKPVLDALQVILTTYNGESPYVDFNRYLTIRGTGPNGKFIFCEAGPIMRIKLSDLLVEKNMISGVRTRQLDGLEIYVYQKYSTNNEGDAVDLVGSNYFVRMADGLYVEIEKVTKVFTELSDEDDEDEDHND